MKNVFYVYALLDPRVPGPFYYGHWKFSHEPFYIGKGKDSRIEHHTKHDFRNKHRLNKLRKIRKEGFEPIALKKRKYLLEKEAFALEKHLISKIGRADLQEGPLTNHTSGGEGSSGHIHSMKTRKIMCAAKQAFLKTEAAEEKRKRAAKTMKATSLRLRTTKTKAELMQWNQRVAEGVSKHMQSLSKVEKESRYTKIAEKNRAYAARLTPKQKKERASRTSSSLQKFWNNVSPEKRAAHGKAISKGKQIYPVVTPAKLAKFVKSNPTCTVFDVAAQFGYREVLNQVGGLRKLKATVLGK